MSPTVTQEKEQHKSQVSLPKTTLRCLVYKPKSNLYIAECVDLDILVRAGTEQEAAKKLVEAIRGYMKVVLEGDITGLVPRPSPFSHRLRYRFYAVLAAFVNAHRNFRLVDLPADMTSDCGI